MIIRKKIIETFMILLLLACVSSLLAQVKTNSIEVTTHDQVTIFTNPKKGVKSFNKWGLFPAKDKDVRRIVMEVTLAHPKDRAIAHWDYMDQIKILRVGGKKGEVKNYEIGRMITPYGSNFKEDWSYTWEVDVTDFQSVLRDSVEIEYMHSGYESPDLGWDLSINFKIDFGKPIANLLSLQEMWVGNYQYGNPENNIEDHLKPIDIKKVEGSSFGSFRIQQTGHGMDRPNGCSEFCNRWREITFDDKIVSVIDLWKECGDNPLYPQGGTWIFDRGHWCPGDLQIPDIVDLLLTNSSHTIDVNMEPFEANDIKQPKEVISSYFFQYSEPLQENDVRIEEIIAPNNASNFNRFNPASFKPTIVIRNVGKENLEEITIKYGTKGYDEKEYEWEGNLKFNEQTTITLPGVIDSKDGLNQFYVELSEPNGEDDEWNLDNKLESEFYGVPTLPTKLVLDFLTNNRPEHNTIFIVNSEGDTVFNKFGKDLDTATTYLDTLALEEGNYALTLVDTAGEGLEFWFMANAGYGRLRLKDINENIIHLFESDCGNGQFYAFRCSEDAVVDTTKEYLSVNIYPRMVKDYLSIYTTTNKPSTLKARITKDGEYVEQHEYTNIKDAITGMDVRHLEKGRYVMEIYLNGEHKMNRRFNKR